VSNPLAVAAVTAVLKKVLSEAVKAENLVAACAQPPTASALPPDRIDVDALAESRLNLFLYHTTLNSGWRNVDLPSADAAGRRLANPPAPVDLHYLVTAYGVNEFETECLLGFAVHIFHELRVLTRDAIRKALAPDPLHPEPTIVPLAAAGLADQIEQIKLAPEPLTTEDLSRLWSAIQTPMRPSVAYLASVVLIQKDDPTKSAPPVRSFGADVFPFRQPVIETVENAAGPREPITAASTLVVRGQNLRGANTLVRLGSAEVPVAEGADAELRVQLALVPAAQLRAGVQPVQIVRPMALGLPPVPHIATESNVAALVLRPTIAPSFPAPPVGTLANGVTTYAGQIRGRGREPARC
jgi:hypothetical protein